MRLLYAHRTRSADGQRVHIDALTGALVRAGVEVFLCGPDGVREAGTAPGTLDAAAGEAGWRVALPQAIHEGAELAYSAREAARLRGAITRLKPDAVYERYNLFAHGVQAARGRLPWLLEVNAPLAEERARHSGLSLRAPARLSERRLWRGADAVLPVTAVLADMIREEGVPPSRIHVVPNGVDERFSAAGDGAAVREKHGLQDAFVLGFTGFVRDWHGVEGALRWLPRRANAALLLVGDGPHVAALRGEAEALGVADRLIVTGTVQREAVPAHIAAFDVALQPAATRYASPLKLQEYMAMGRAILACDQPNIREVVADGESAVLFPPGDEPAMHAGLDRLSADEALRTRLGTGARETVARRNLTWDGNAQRVVAIAEALIEGGRARGARPS